MVYDAIINIRNSYRSWSVRKGVSKLTEKHLCQSTLFNKVAGYRPEETLAQVFSCEFCEISESIFLYRIPLGDYFYIMKGLKASCKYHQGWQSVRFSQKLLRNRFLTVGFDLVFFYCCNNKSDYVPLKLNLVSYIWSFCLAHCMFNPDTMACGVGNGCKGTYFSWHCDCKMPGTVLDKSNTSQCLDGTYSFIWLFIWLFNSIT